MKKSIVLSLAVWIAPICLYGMHTSPQRDTIPSQTFFSLEDSSSVFATSDVPHQREKRLTHDERNQLRIVLSDIIKDSPQYSDQFIVFDWAKIAKVIEKKEAATKQGPATSAQDTKLTVLKKIFNPTTVTVGALCALTGWLAATKLQQSSE